MERDDLIGLGISIGSMVLVGGVTIWLIKASDKRSKEQQRIREEEEARKAAEAAKREQERVDALNDAKRSHSFSQDDILSATTSNKSFTPDERMTARTIVELYLELMNKAHTSSEYLKVYTDLEHILNEFTEGEREAKAANLKYRKKAYDLYLQKIHDDEIRRSERQKVEAEYKLAKAKQDAEYRMEKLRLDAENDRIRTQMRWVR